jgi:molybdopterin-guanine dinucleotide biosynthesis protein B
MRKSYNHSLFVEGMSTVIVKVNGKQLPLNEFAHRVIESTVKGLLSPLRGYEEGEITIHIK